MTHTATVSRAFVVEKFPSVRKSDLASFRNDPDAVGFEAARYIALSK